MTRRDFITLTATIAAAVTSGVGASAAGIEAIERVFNANAPRVDEGLIFIRRITLCGCAEGPLPVVLGFGGDGGKQAVLRPAMNLYGGVFMYGVSADQPLFAQRDTFGWTQANTALVLPGELVGTVEYVGQDGIWYVSDITSPTQMLSAAPTRRMC